MSYKSFISILFVLCSFGLKAEIRTVTILQTTDIHSELVSWRKDIPHGWFKLGTIIEQERKEAGYQNTLLVDCGDTIQGSMIASLTRGEVAVKLLNLLKYDFWIIGNHEFDFGLNRLNELINMSKATPLLANMSYPNQSKKFIPWKIIEINGAKIAIIGMGCTSTLDRSFGKKLPGLNIESIDKAFAKNIPVIMTQKPDMIILAMHNGLYGGKRDSGNYIPEIISKYPQIDLVLGGHIHQEDAGQKIGRSTWYAQSGCHGKYLLRVVVKIDTTKHCVINIYSRLIPVKENTPELQSMKMCIKNELKSKKKFSWKKVGVLLNPLKPLESDRYNSQLSELFSKSIAEQCSVDIVLQAAGSDYEIKAGQLTEWSLFKAYPYEDTIFLLDLTKQQLTSIIQEQLNSERDKHFLSPYGIIITLDKDNNITQIDLENGSKWEKGERKTVAFSSYSLSSAGNRFPILKSIANLKEVNARDTKMTIRDIVRKFLQKNSPVHIEIEDRVILNLF